MGSLTCKKRMVHKKYTYKNGKRFGPYYYETKRVNGKVVTTYLGSKHPEKNKNYLMPFLFFALLGVLLLIFLVFPGFTGRVSLDVNSNIRPGDIISGNLRLNINQGELVPADSLIRVDYNQEEYEFLLKDLISVDLISGDFYAVGSGISGTGDGYGIIGKKEIYPEVEFEFEVYESGEASNIPIVSDGEIEGEDDVVEKGNVTEKIDGNESIEGNATEEVEGNETIPDEEPGEEIEEEEEPEVEPEEVEEEVEETEVKPEEEPEVKPEVEEESEESAGITGAAVSEQTISALVTGDNPYEYNIEPGQDIRIIRVVINGSEVDNGVVKLRRSGKTVEFRTDYSLKEEGFGQDYIGDKKLRLNIALEDLGVIAVEDGDFVIGMEYEGSSIVEVEGEVDVVEVEGNVTGNETIIGNDTNIVEPNITIETNVTGNVTVNTTQFGAVLGQPVKWVKRVGVRGPASVRIEIPKSAGNVSVKKVEKSLEEIEAENSEDMDEVDISNGTGENIIEEPEENITDESNIVDEQVTGDEVPAVEKPEENDVPGLENKLEKKIKVGITGEVSVDLEIDNGFSIVDWFKGLFGITGRVVEELNNTQEVVVEVTDLEKAVEIEYETPGPELGFEEISNKGKRLGITSLDDVHYQDVLIFTDLPEELDVRTPERVRIYWEENATYLPVLNINDSDGNGIYDYLEFVAPQLSNQTFNIIVITKAEHLDENRSFISDIYDDVKELDGNWSETIFDGDYVRVSFEKNLTPDRDITIYPRTINGTPRLDIYEINGTQKIAGFDSINDEELNKVYLDGSSGAGLQGEQDSFDLRVLGGSLEFDWIVDPLGGTNNWICSSLQEFSNASCWSLGSVPVSGENVVLNASGTGDVNVTNNTMPQDLSSFRVDSGYTGTVHYNALFAKGSWGSYGAIGSQEWNVTNNISVYGGTHKIYGSFVGNATDSSGYNISEEGEGQIWNGKNITLGQDAVLDGNGLGFPVSTGPGGGNDLAEGGVHATTGNYGSIHDIYGNASAPTSLGSGGGVPGQGEPGGSAIKLKGDSVVIEGNITMDGLGGVWGQGAGGSIWIKADNISGSGELSASTQKKNDNRGGGAGRIRLEYGSEMSYDGLIDLEYGGKEISDNDYQIGTLTFTNNTWPNDWTIDGYVGLLGGDYGEGEVVNVEGDFVVNGNLVVWGDCFFNITNSVTCYNKTANGRGVWINSSGNITISSGALVAGMAKGFPKRVGPGAGTWGGGSHGGEANGGGTHVTYGSALEPTSLGSGGSWGLGGSAVKFESLNKIVVDGDIRMDGDEHGNHRGGAGGSIWLMASKITGSGNLNSTGSFRGTNSAAGGGGGRITFTSSDYVNFTGNLDVRGQEDFGSDFDDHGGGGTIYINATNSISLSGNVLAIGGGDDVGNAGSGGGYINVTDSLLGLSGIFNASVYNISKGLVGNITFNYTDCSSTFTGTFDPNYIDNGPVCDTTPSVTITFPQNRTLYYSETPLNFSVTLNEAADEVWYTLDGGTNNVTMTTDGAGGYSYNHTNTSLPDGSYTFNVYANDTSGNLNDTETVTFYLNQSLISYCTNVTIGNKNYWLNNSIGGDWADCISFKTDNVTLYGQNNYIESSVSGGELPVGNADRAIQVLHPFGNFTIEDVNITKYDVSVGMFTEDSSLGGDSGANFTIKDDNIDVISADAEATTIINDDGGNGGEIYLYEVNVSSNISSSGTNGIGTGNGGNGGYVYIENKIVNLSSVLVELDYGAGSPDGVAGRLIINYTDLFDDLNADYGTNMSLTLINGSGTGSEIMWYDRFDSSFISNLSLNTVLSNNYVFVNATALSPLNISANITLRGISDTFTNPEIKKDGVTCSDCYNFTSLSAATVIFNVTGFSNYSIGEAPNNAPTVTINFPANQTYNKTSLPLNFNVSLNEEGSVYYSLDTGINNVTMFNETAGLIGLFFNATNSSIANGSYTFNVYANDTSGNLNYTENITFSYIHNTPPPPPVLETPSDGSNTTDRTPVFTWVSVTDPEGDTVSYELNVSLIASSLCTDYARYFDQATLGAANSKELEEDLKCLYDNNDYYNWTVRAYDGELYSDWAEPYRINISSLIITTLINDSVEFGNIHFQGTNDTSDGYPSPFVIQNDGNSFVNSTISATNLWNTESNPTDYYQFKVDNYTAELFSFAWDPSTTIYTAMPAVSTLFLVELNYTNATDIAEIDINVTVPPDEGSDVRSSVVTFTSSLAE